MHVFPLPAELHFKRLARVRMKGKKENSFHPVQRQTLNWPPCHARADAATRRQLFSCPAGASLEGESRIKSEWGGSREGGKGEGDEIRRQNRRSRPSSLRRARKLEADEGCSRTNGRTLSLISFS